ncbi:Wadjet anti-phage system protein JetA family protein [Clostridium sp. E02]|uniref:Wadjet anti-phage system protein JetA family protein n=1 Tax=Clostridium sp. E02 TaxID=2487134 RepID=UPI000F5345F0|nr:Wadjet anti-phage system protein JetA family protein [Clostridium sp. E02]
MILMSEIPDRFWGLFRSINRTTYIEALLKINEEYEYSNYFLSREVCLQVLEDYFIHERRVIWQDELEDETDALEPPASRVLNWLLKAGWLRKVDEYASMTVNIVIPDYAAVMIEAFFKLTSDLEDETQIYIQNIYAILFSLKHDKRASVSLLNTAYINTKRLNKILQDMLHNMDKFFSSLLEQKAYGELLKEHLEGYVEEIVKKKYHILKTTDNFYLYKNDIKHWIREMGEDIQWMDEMSNRSGQKVNAADIAEKLDQIERGFDDIEHRITNMDKEHSRYIRATVTRLNYLLNQEDNMKGLVIRLLNHLSEAEDPDEAIKEAGNSMNVSQLNILSEKSLYKKRKGRTNFKENLMPDEELVELTEEEILNLNRLKSRYSRKEIENYMESHSVNGRMEVKENTVQSNEELEKLILAYDYSIRKKSLYEVKDMEPESIDNGKYRYPRLVFVRRKER